LNVEIRQNIGGPVFVGLIGMMSESEERDRIWMKLFDQHLKLLVQELVSLKIIWR
jgi:hypothetical protein